MGVDRHGVAVTSTSAARAEPFVSRSHHPADRRAKLVTPTAKGREVLELVGELVPEIESDVAALLGVERAAALRDDLERLSSTQPPQSTP